jgi:hypothetical protein
VEGRIGHGEDGVELLSDIQSAGKIRHLGMGEGIKESNIPIYAIRWERLSASLLRLLRQHDFKHRSIGLSHRDERIPSSLNASTSVRKERMHPHEGVGMTVRKNSTNTPWNSSDPTNIKTLCRTKSNI